MKRKIDQQQKTVGGWRNERHARMLENGIGADVFFLVGKPCEAKELISAHKYMLSAMSDMFEGQFSRFDKQTGTQEGTEEKPIEVTDIHPNAFRAMLKFMYSEDFSGVNKQNVLDVYNAGKKYIIDALVMKCRQSLMNDDNLDANNMLSALKIAQYHQDKVLIEHCWTFVERKDAKAVIDSEDFPLLEEADLRDMFRRNIPGIKEVKAHLLATGKGAKLHDLFNLFANIKFVLIQRRGVAWNLFKKSGYRNKVEALGGQIVDDFSSVQPEDEKICYLVADKSFRTYKYLCALSLSIPCVSYSWMQECVAQSKLLDHKPFLLPSGESTLEPGRLFPWKPLKGHLFKGVHVIVYCKSFDFVRFLSYPDSWTSLLRNMGATIVGSGPDEPFSLMGQHQSTMRQKLEYCEKNKFDVLLTEKDCEKELAEYAQAKRALVVSGEWVIQAIVTAELPDVNASDKFRYDFA